MMEKAIRISYQQATDSIKNIQEGMRKQLKQVSLVPFIVSMVFGIISLISIGSIEFTLLIMGVIIITFGFVILIGAYLTFREIRILRVIQETILILINDYDKILKFDRIIRNLELILFGVKEILGSLHSFYTDKNGKIDKKNQIVKSYTVILNFLYQSILDLRSDLATRLTEQQKILEGAKSEVEKNIGGTTELESVSELQRARLDRQIEQFEELQRVLVKV